MASQASHIKSAKIGAGLFVVSVTSYFPLVYSLLSAQYRSGYLYFVIFINNFANFFVYAWIDEKFRASLPKCKRGKKEDEGEAETA